jgi:hypothetical protein
MHAAQLAYKGLSISHFPFPFLWLGATYLRLSLFALITVIGVGVRLKIIKSAAGCEGLCNYCGEISIPGLLENHLGRWCRQTGCCIKVISYMPVCNEVKAGRVTHKVSKWNNMSNPSARQAVVRSFYSNHLL